VSVSVAGGAGILLAGIEAMAAGLPLVAWDTPMYRQFIEHGRTGMLVPQGDVQALAAALASLLADAPRRRELGQLAHAAAKAYDWSVAAARLIEVLDRVWDVDRQPERP
ncbi:MAG TPA: glycosyltransferase, partial [Dehalococcoidia bacterium]|nr:glycosyltransferase [Dehalococcoidia bacterium]